VNSDRFEKKKDDLCAKSATIRISMKAQASHETVST
jgi:hypothetical protein